MVDMVVVLKVKASVAKAFPDIGTMSIIVPTCRRAKVMEKERASIMKGMAKEKEAQNFDHHKIKICFIIQFTR